MAEQAIPYAVARAERFGAELVPVRVLEPLRGSAGVSRAVIEPAERRMNASTREYLGGVAPSIEEQGVPVQAVTIQGRPHGKIVRFAETNQVGLIVICARGHSGYTRWLMGSVTDRVHVGRTSRCP